MKQLLLLVLISGSCYLTSCKGKKPSDQESQGSETAPSTPAQTSAGSSNSTKIYQVVVTPDSALLGKNREALVRVTKATAVPLQTPDGKDNGTELVVYLTLTNKIAIGKGESLHVDYPDSRLQLDNGNNITCDKGSDFLRAEPEATSHEEYWTYTVPAGAKPKGLNFFLDGTRVSVGLTLKD